MRPASQRFFIHSYIYLRILITSDLATFLGTNSFSVLMCCIAVNQSNTSIINDVESRDHLETDFPGLGLGLGLDSSGLGLALVSSGLEL